MHFVVCFLNVGFLWLFQLSLDEIKYLKIFIVLLVDFIIAEKLYTGISTIALGFFVSLEYLLSYCLSFTIGMICSTICGMDSDTFKASEFRVIVYGVIAYSLQLFLVLIFRKIMRQSKFKQSQHSLRTPQITLYWLFPCASFMVLIVLLYISTGKKSIRSYDSSYLWVDYCCKRSNNFSPRTYGTSNGTRTTAIFIGATA